MYKRQGVGASRVRDLFKEAAKVAPCIVFIDEIDTIGKSRDSGRFGGNDEREQTLNQLLAEMDGFDPTKGIILLAATNRPEVLDQALLRPGRFDRRIIIDRPNLAGRLATLQVHTRSIHLADMEYRILTLFIRHPNTFFTANELYRKIWGKESLGDVRTVQVHIHNLRSKIEPDPAKPIYLKNVWGKGYIFQPEGRGAD